MRLIQHIKASNLLSFGPEGLDLELQNLNVLIGPNGSGKSNFLEIFEVLRSLPRSEEDSNNLNAVISRGGGMSEWRWKGSKKGEVFIEVDIVINFLGTLPLNHLFYIDIFGTVDKEFIGRIPEEEVQKISNFYEKIRYKSMSVWDAKTNTLEEVIDQPVFNLSVLSQRYNYPINLLTEFYERIRLYREWSFGRNTVFRIPQRADQRNDRLESDFSNLGMFLSRLRKDPPTKRALVAALQELYEGITDFEVITEGGAIQIFFSEGDFSIPATRLSDGTLRYLCLIALLLDPTPPPLICIEEPELGLHPDIMPKIADLLVDASKRTQLIVTTHSDVLIDALSEQPESVLVCEKHEGQTQIKRLNREDISHWLADYRLGQLWMRGEIGGTRW